MSRVLGCFIFACFAFSLGCGGPAGRQTPLAPVKGTVNLDGKPMAAGEIAFLAPSEVPRRFPVANGAFSGEAPEGNNKIEISAFKDGPPLSTDPEKKPTKINSLPAKYHANSTMTAQVKQGTANEFKFDVTSR